MISFADATLRNQTRGVASYYDMLGEKAFGNFRDLLEGVTYHPMMGIYLSHLKNQKEDAGDRPGSRPELRARDHAAVRGRPVQAQRRRHRDHGHRRPSGDGLQLRRPERPVAGLHRPQLVRGPGSSPTAPPPASAARCRTSSATGGRCRRTTSTPPNTSFHSISEKNFLGTTIPAMTKPTTDADVKIALDTLFNHPNVGPFIGKQLIQRLVTSNPSPAYVGRVTAAFNNNGRASAAT